MPETALLLHASWSSPYHERCQSPQDSLIQYMVVERHADSVTKPCFPGNVESSRLPEYRPSGVVSDPVRVITVSSLAWNTSSHLAPKKRMSRSTGDGGCRLWSQTLHARAGGSTPPLDRGGNGETPDGDFGVRHLPARRRSRRPSRLMAVLGAGSWGGVDTLSRYGLGNICFVQGASP